ncbi:MAG: hypothetical protein VXY90_08815, partial [Pseudomonadota bacterium]|nr:hypothetical protein [Pseudomonadota bacterium]
LDLGAQHLLRRAARLAHRRLGVADGGLARGDLVRELARGLGDRRLARARRPTRGAASTTRTFIVGSARSLQNACARPAGPPPTTMTTRAAA